MKFTFYRDHKKEWRWRLRARNGRIVAVAGEGYKNRKDAEDVVLRLRVIVDHATSRLRKEWNKCANT